MRVAILGAGPKGLYAAEALLAAAGDRVRLEVWDPRPPGTGAAYAPDQPPWLRLNVSAAIVDGFDAWRTARGEGTPLDPFPPRALLGAYLADRWAALGAAHPAALTHRARAATSVEATAEGAWRVDGVAYAEVLLATGHAEDSPDALAHGWRGGVPLVDRPYPVTGLRTIRPGSTVAVRGAALTFIDVALALTEGRGGRFTGDPYAPTYRPSGDEPASLRPTARRGRFPTAKPQPSSPTTTLPVHDALDAGLRSVLGATDAAAALTVVPDLARRYLAVAGITASDAHAGAGVDAVFAGAPGHPDPVEALRTSVEVAAGRAAPDAVWAVGRAWRDLYPALVARFSLAGGLEFAPFADAAARLEGVAFGPPPVNAAKLLALIEAGLVDASALATDSIDPDGHRGPVRADVVVDAVLPGPGVVTGSHTLPGRLVASGLLARCPGRRGLLLDPDGTCRSPDGRRLDGLSAAGRPSEDVVIGNDTLSATLHPTIRRWATRVAHRSREDT